MALDRDQREFLDGIDNFTEQTFSSQYATMIRISSAVLVSEAPPLSNRAEDVGAYNVSPRNIRRLAGVGAVVLALALAACGGDDGSETASVGDCINAENNVVDCDSSSATKELVSDQSEPDAIACVTIGDNPQVEVTVGDRKFCAEER